MRWGVERAAPGTERVLKAFCWRPRRTRHGWAWLEYVVVKQHYGHGVREWLTDSVLYPEDYVARQLGVKDAGEG